MWNAVRFPPPYDGPILSGRIDGAAYLLGWLATFAHLTLWVVVLALGLHNPWTIISTVTSVVATLLLLTIDGTSEELTARVGRDTALRPGERTWISLGRSAIQLFDPATTRVIVAGGSMPANAARRTP